MKRSTIVAIIVAVALAACRSAPPQEEGDPQAAAPQAGFDVVFQGNEHMGAGHLRKAIEASLEDFEASGYAEAFVDDAAFDIQETYRVAGYASAEVGYAIEREGRVAIRFEIEEGPRTLVAEVTFEGNQASGFDDDSLHSFFDWERTGLLGGRDLIYIEDRARAAARAIEEAYVDAGHLVAKVAAPEVKLDEGRTRADVHLRIAEGPLFRIRVLPTKWETEPDRTLYTSCETALLGGLSKDSAYFPQLPHSLRGKLIDALHRAGRPEAEVDFERTIDLDRGEVVVQFTIEPGPEITVADIRFEGAHATRLNFLESRMKLEKGDRFDSSKVRESILRLYDTGLFRSVSVDLADAEEGADATHRDLIVKIAEGRSIDLFVEPGWGSYELARVRFGVREKNLRGTGRQLNLEAKAAVRAQSARIDLIDPWFARTDYIGRLSVDYDRRENPSFTGIDAGAGAFITKRWKRRPDVSTTVGYEYRQSFAQDVLVGPTLDPDLEEALSKVNLSSIQIDHRVDSRDSFLDATAGSFGEISMGVGSEAIGSELDFVRARLSLQHYRAMPFLEDTVLATALRMGVMAPYGSDDFIPIQERLFNGGENSVRSFKQSELGPKDAKGEPFGGEGSSVLSVELRRHWRERWSGALFFDAGHVALQASDYFDFEFAGLGVGVGLRYMTPVGPVRVDLAANPDPDEFEDEVVLHFALGMAF